MASTATRSRVLLPLLIFLLAHVASASFPLVDFNRMGTVGLTGSFAGLDVFSSNESTSVTFNPQTSTLLSRSSDGSLSALGSTNAGGAIVAGCALGDIYYFGGSFTSIGNVTTNNIAAYSPSSGSFSALGTNGPNGEVRALFCDSTHNNVWVGGSFTSPGSAIALWNTGSSSWSAAPFGGLAGSVSSIAPNASDSSVFVAGSFLASFGNLTLNDTNNPNVPYSPGASPFSSSLVPIPLQNAQITAGPSSTDPSFDNVNVILCPTGNDGPGESWFAADGSSAVITVRTFSVLSARGVRLGNTFQQGRGTTGFSVTTIPDNTVQTLTYLDPQTGVNETCSTTCPLSTDSSILYQDFLFDDSLTITGVQITLSEWQGAGPGLHILQLLSSGAFAFATGSENSASCFAPSASNVSMTGTWTEVDATTDIAGTVQTVLVSDVAVGTSAAQGPSFTWHPYVSASGNYDIYLEVPGCDDFQDCDLRTSVQVTVFPGGGLDPYVSTVSQQNTDDASNLIYSGPIVPSSPEFVTTITMALAPNVQGQGENGQYELVADSVQLVLTSANATAGGSSSGNSTGSAQNSFGFLEWPLSSTTTISASSALPTSSETSADTLGFDLYNALGGQTAVTSSGSAISAVVQHSSGTIIVAGTFQLTSGSASGVANIVAYKGGNLVALANNGLNGAVTSLALDGDQLYIGGTFTDTSSASTNGKLSGVAMYNVAQNQWSALSSGVNGPVSSVDVSNSQVLVAGNFTSPVGVASETAAGFATWNISTSSWVNSGGFLVGNMSFVGNGTSGGQFVAGNIATSLSSGATSFVLLQNGAGGAPEINPIPVQLSAAVATSGSSSSVQRRHWHSQMHGAASAWLPKVSFSNVFKRQSSSDLAPLPAPNPAPAPAVLAGAFWTNATSGKQMVVIGGNFSFSANGQTAQNVAIYDNSTGTIEPLVGTQISGVVSSLFVQGDELFVGGNITLANTNVNGIALYNLATQSWDISGLQPLQASSGSSVTVRSITLSPSSSSSVIVAGSFASAGSLACRAICSLDWSSKQWTQLGNGIQGDVASVTYAGSTLVAAGSIALADGTGANVAEFNFGNSSWSSVGNGGDLPGPVTAVAVNDGNSSSIFAAGKSSDGTSSFLFFWDGQTWTAVGGTLESSTDVAQLTMVPLQNTHTANSIIESDRMLLVSGSLSDSSFGNASAALFDGQTLIPYIVTASASGTPGAISSLIYSLANFSFTQTSFLATGIVILISIAIAAGIVFLLVLIGILWTLFSRRDDKLANFNAAEVEDDDTSSHRPSSLLAHINAATRNTILSGAAFGPPHTEKEYGADAPSTTEHSHHPYENADASNYLRAETPSDAVIGTGGDDPGRPAHARYSFDGQGEGELPLSAGQELEVLDDADASWWYARDIRSGREGVVPAAYVY